MNATARHPAVRVTDPHRRRPGYLLLEVVISLGLLVMGLATIGMQIQTAYETAVGSHQTLRAMQLAQSKLDELDAGLILDVQSAVENDLEDEFGRLFPDFGWRLRIDPLKDTPEMWLIQMHILYYNRLDPDDEFRFDEAETVFTIRTLRATPATINLSDFIPGLPGGGDNSGLADGSGGMSPEEEEQFQCVLEVLNQYEIDPLEIDLADLGRRPMEDLIGIYSGTIACGVTPSPDFLPPNVQDGIGALLDGGTGDGGGASDGGDPSP